MSDWSFAQGSAITHPYPHNPEYGCQSDCGKDDCRWLNCACPGHVHPTILDRGTAEEQAHFTYHFHIVAEGPTGQQARIYHAHQGSVEADHDHKTLKAYYAHVDLSSKDAPRQIDSY